MRSPLRFRLEALAFQALFAVARLMPRRWLLACGSAAGMLGYRLDARHRRIGIANLHRAFGDDLPRRDARRLLARCWRHFGRVTFDTLCFPRFDEESIGTLIHYDGLEHIRRAYDRGKGVLLFSGHFGHWELTALMQGVIGMPLTLVTRPLDNPLLETRLAALRGRTGNRVLHKRKAAREMLRVLRKGEGVAIVIDQDAQKHGIFVPFFGHPASTTPTLARLALRTGAAVIPSFAIPGPRGSYRIVYEPEVVFEQPGPGSGDSEEAVRQLTAHCTAIIEARVRRDPELWLWMHRRWKTRPPDSC